MNYLKKSIAALILGGAASLGVMAEESLSLFQFFNDSEKTRPRQNEPYRIWMNGSIVDHNVTDRLGNVITTRRVPGTQQEFLMQLFLMGTYSFNVDKKGGITTEKISSWETDDDWKNVCSEKSNDCNGQGFYWIQLLGADYDFENEPYILSINGTKVTGVVEKHGYIKVDQKNPKKISDPMTLQICGATMKIRAGISQKYSSAAPIGKIVWDRSQLGPTCGKSRFLEYAEANPSLNGGMPYLFSEWSKGLSPEGKQNQVLAERQEELDEFSALAKANDDEFAWLGSLPKTWVEKDFNSRFDELQTAIVKDLRNQDSQAIKKFVCKKPAEVGPVPDINAVNDFIAEFPKSISNPALRGPLGSAAAKGNWLAIAQIHTIRNQFPPGGNRYVNKYRSLQIMEWMQSRKIGALYREYAYALAASGYPGAVDGIEEYAALHSSYPAQHEVGQRLMNEENPTLRAVGEKMMDCAQSALPAYAKVLR